MLITNETLDKLYAKLEKRHNTLEENYNCTGSASTYNSMRYYEELMDTVSLAREHLNGRCSGCDRHRANAEHLANQWQAYKDTGMASMLEFDRIIDDIKSIIL